MHISTDAHHHNPMMPIDTLAISKRLQSAGTPKKQAEMQAEVLGEIITHNLASKTDIAMLQVDIEALRKETKSDIEMLRKESKADTEMLRKESKADIEMLRKESKADTEMLRKDLTIEIEKIKSDIMKWIIPLMAGQLAATAGLFKFFTH